MTWTVQLSGHKAGDDSEYEEVKEALREMVRTLREKGHTVGVHSVNGEDVEAQ